MANTPIENTEEIKPTPPTPAGLPVIVVDAGKVSRSSLKKLKRGRGKLMTELDEVVARVRQELGAEIEGREILPVALICQKKRGRKKRRGLLSFID